MRNINRVTLLGIVGRDPEIRMSKSGIKVGNISVATNKTDREGKETTQWHKCVAFAKTADYVELHIKRSSKVLLEGELQYSEYEKDGAKTFSAKIIISAIASMHDMPKENTNDEWSEPVKTPSQAVGPGPGSAYYSKGMGTDLEEELPF